MSELETLISRIFHQYHKEPALTIARERELVEAAKEGDSDAFSALALGYATGLRGAAAQLTSGGFIEAKEAHEELMYAFSIEVMTFNPDGEYRLSYHLSAIVSRIKRQRTAEQTQGLMSENTVYRYNRLDKACNGDMRQMQARAREFGTSPDTVLEVWKAYRMAGLDNPDGTPNENVSALEHHGPSQRDSTIVDFALSLLEGEPVAAKVVHYDCGFDEPESRRKKVHSNAEIGELVGLGTSTVGRLKARTYQQMRAEVEQWAMTWS